MAVRVGHHLCECRLHERLGLLVLQDPHAGQPLDQHLLVPDVLQVAVDSLPQHAPLVRPLQLVGQTLGHLQSQVVTRLGLPGLHQPNQATHGNDLDRIELTGLVDHVAQRERGGGVTGGRDSLGRIALLDDQFTEQVGDVQADVEVLHAPLATEDRAGRIAFEETYRLTSSLHRTQHLQAVGLERLGLGLAGLGIGTGHYDLDLLAVVVGDLEMSGLEQLGKRQGEFTQYELTDRRRLDLQLDHLTNFSTTNRQSLAVGWHCQSGHLIANARTDVLLSLGAQPGRTDRLHEGRVSPAAERQFVFRRQQSIVETHHLGQRWRRHETGRQRRTRWAGRLLGRRFLGRGFLVAGFLVAGFLVRFLGCRFLGRRFLGAGFLAAGFLAAGCLAAGWA